MEFTRVTRLCVWLCKHLIWTVQDIVPNSSYISHFEVD